MVSLIKQCFILNYVSSETNNTGNESLASAPCEKSWLCDIDSEDPPVVKAQSCCLKPQGCSPCQNEFSPQALCYLPPRTGHLWKGKVFTLWNREEVFITSLLIGPGQGLVTLGERDLDAAWLSHIFAHAFTNIIPSTSFCQPSSRHGQSHRLSTPSWVLGLILPWGWKEERVGPNLVFWKIAPSSIALFILETTVN